MNLVFRTDASIQMGTGHIMRCLTLADALKERGAESSFICRQVPGNLSDFIEAKGFPVDRLVSEESSHSVPQSNDLYAKWLSVPWQRDAKETKAILNAKRNVDILIVDHYALDNRWESLMRPLVHRIMAIDDIANRHHDCDLLLDQNLYQDPEMRYDGLVPNHCRKFLGPKFALLRPEFLEARNTLRKREGIVSRILIFFGGSDPNNETENALEAIRLLNRSDIVVDVVVGATNPRREEIREHCRRIPNAMYHCQVDNMAQLMADADLAIGGGGIATWERCILGLPAISLVVANNQAETTAAVAQSGAVYNLGFSESVSVERLAEAVKSALIDSGKLKKMSERAMELMGGPPFLERNRLIDAILRKNHAEA